MLLHGHVAISGDEVTFGDNVIDRKLCALYIHLSHPFANGILSFRSLVADHGPDDIIRALRQESFHAAFGKARIYLSTISLFLADIWFFLWFQRHVVTQSEFLSAHPNSLEELYRCRVYTMRNANCCFPSGGVKYKSKT